MTATLQETATHVYFSRASSVEVGGSSSEALEGLASRNEAYLRLCQRHRDNPSLFKTQLTETPNPPLKLKATSTNEAESASHEAQVSPAEIHDALQQKPSEA